MKKILTLTLIEQDGKLLLGQKKRGFGVGKWNGLGGKLMPGETVEQANCREYREECGIDLLETEKVAVLDFEFRHNPEIMEVHLFRGRKWSGQPVETEEILPRWFGLEEIPFAEMWPDDRHWLPLFLAGKTFVGKFYYDEGGRDIIGHRLVETDVLP